MSHPTRFEKDVKTIVLCLDMVAISGEAKLILPELYTKPSRLRWRSCEVLEQTQWGPAAASPPWQLPSELSQSLDWLKIPKETVGKEKEEEKSRKQFGGWVGGSQALSRFYSIFLSISTDGLSPREAYLILFYLSAQQFYKVVLIPL